MIWKGWHALRRGLATNLHEMGVPTKVIQRICRYADEATTKKLYMRATDRACDRVCESWKHHRTTETRETKDRL